MTDESPLVTVLIPARNEARDIRNCIEAIGAQDYPLDRLEVIVVDGGSTDGTADLVQATLSSIAFAASGVLDNPDSSTPSNLNVGLGRAGGEIVCRVDARTLVEPHYVRTCVDVLTSRPDVVVVGGSQIAVARDGRAKSVGIARALNNRFAMGWSRYRSGSGSGSSDTVYLGAFRAAQLRDAGGWDERFRTNQDFELNRRMGGLGVVWFETSLRSGYLPRDSLGDLMQQYLRFGRSKSRYWRITGERPQPRQLVLLAAGPIAAFGLAALSRLSRAARRRAAMCLVAAGVVVEGRGSSGPPGGTAERAWSLAAMACTTVGWLSGVYVERFIRAGKTSAGG